MPIATKAGFGLTALGIEPLNPKPNVSEDIQQTLTRLMIWDENNKLWRPAAADLDGRLIISMSGVSTNTAVNGVITCGVTATLLLASRPTRRKFILYNSGGYTIFIGFTNGVTGSNGFPMTPAATYIEEQYNGNIWAISPSGACSVRYMDF